MKGRVASSEGGRGEKRGEMLEVVARLLKDGE